MIQTDDDAANPSMDGPYWEKKRKLWRTTAIKLGRKRNWLLKKNGDFEV